MGYWEHRAKVLQQQQAELRKKKVVNTEMLQDQQDFLRRDRSPQAIQREVKQNIIRQQQQVGMDINMFFPNLIRKKNKNQKEKNIMRAIR